MALQTNKERSIGIHRRCKKQYFLSLAQAFMPTPLSQEGEKFPSQDILEQM
jgi:hypothetical protein